MSVTSRRHPDVGSVSISCSIRANDKLIGSRAGALKFNLFNALPAPNCSRLHANSITGLVVDCRKKLHMHWVKLVANSILLI